MYQLHSNPSIFTRVVARPDGWKNIIHKHISRTLVSVKKEKEKNQKL